MNWRKILKGKVKKNEPLAKHTTFKIGGKARLFVEPDNLEDLKSLVAWARKAKAPLLVIGAGSNILAGDKGTEAVVLHLNSACFKGIGFKKNRLKAGSAVLLARAIQSAKNRGLGGLEFLAGIPGTIGGALVMNAGAWGRNIGELTESVTVMGPDAKIRVLKRKQIKFGYRKSNLDKYIILSACFKLKPQGKGEIAANIKKYLGFRRDKQDTSLPNAGCVFKNPAGKSAGKLIDLCGLKGKKAGGAVISLRHANFILNRDKARATDVLKLIALAKKKVKEKFKVTLEPEIKIWH